MVLVIRTVVDQAVVEALQSSTFGDAVELVLNKIELEHDILDDLATISIDILDFTILVAIFVKNEVWKCFLVQAQTKERQKEVGERSWCFQDGRISSLTPIENSSSRVPSLQWTYLIRRKLARRCTLRRRFWKSRIAAIIQLSTEMRGTGNIVTAIIISLHHLSRVGEQIPSSSSKFYSL